MAVFSDFSEHYGIGTKKVTAMHHFNDHRSFLELLVIYCSRCEAAMWLLLTNSCQKTKQNKKTILISNIILLPVFQRIPNILKSLLQAGGFLLFIYKMILAFW